METNRRSLGEEAAEDAVRVTRSIMIVRPSQKDSPPVSPAGSTPPVSPFAGEFIQKLIDSVAVLCSIVDLIDRSIMWC